MPAVPFSATGSTTIEFLMVALTLFAGQVSQVSQE